MIQWIHIILGWVESSLGLIVSLTEFLFVIITVYIYFTISFIQIHFLKSYLKILCFFTDHFSFCDWLVFQNNRLIRRNFHRSDSLNLLKLLVIFIMLTYLVSARRIRLRKYILMRLLQIFQITLIHFIGYSLRRSLKNIHLLIGSQIAFYSICNIMDLIFCFLRTSLCRCKLLLKLYLFFQFGRCFVYMRLLIY